MTSLGRRRLTASLAAIAAAPITRPVFAQSGATGGTLAYPTKPLRIIASSPPGGMLDAYSRVFAESYTAKYNLPAVVDNRPGASGIIAIEAMLAAPPDGYTVVMGTTGMVWQARVLYRKLPYDLAKDITPVTVYPTGPLVLAATERSGIRDFKGMVDYARAQRCSMGNYVMGSYQQVFAETLNRDSGCKIDMVHYKGEPPMWLEMGSGAIDIAIGSFSSFFGVRDKGIRAIAAVGKVRSPRMPELPTMIEQGFNAPIARMEASVPMIASSAVPEAVLDTLSRLAIETNDTARAKAMRENFGIPDTTKGRAEALRMWREDAPVWIKEVQALNLKLD